MNLEYNILWVDDNREGLEDVFDTHIKGQIESLGFMMNLIKAEDENKLNEILNEKKYFNLIFMDYSFDDENKGIDFIKEIRKKDIYCNILFYSAQNTEELKEAIKQNDLNGIYIYYRPNILRDIDKIKKMIEFNILNNLDESAMRGIAMAQVAEIDHILLDIVRLLPDDDKWIQIEHNHKYAKSLYCKKNIDNMAINEEEKAVLRKKCVEILEITNDEFKEAILEDAEKSSKIFPTSARVDFLSGNRIFNNIIGNYNKEMLVLFKKYKTDVVEYRNKLAHYKSPGEIDYAKLRKDIIKHKQNIIQIVNELKRQAKNENVLESAL